MEKDESNYELLDTLVANSKKSNRWTIGLVLLLCVLSGFLINSYYTIKEKNETISKNNEVILSKDYAIARLDTFLTIQSKALDTLRVKYTTVVYDYINDIQLYVENARNNSYRNDDELRVAGELLYQVRDEFTLFVDSVKSETHRLRNQFVEKKAGY